MTATRDTRIGGHVVADSLHALGAEVAFGLPGVHSLGIWEGLRTSRVATMGFRTELNAGFAADGYARVSGRPAPLLLSTGPGALVALAALMEAASSHVPVVAISSQIPGEHLGRGRGYLHELRDQIASFAPIVKWVGRADTAEAVPELLTEAWTEALTAPTGPVFVEIPVDVILGETAVAVSELAARPAEPPLPEAGALADAARILASAERPLIWAGGGVLRSEAWPELQALAERLDAPVAATFMGKSAFPEDHPLFASSACYDANLKTFLEDADAVLCVGTELGSETTYEYTLRFGGPVVQIDVAAERIGATYPVHGLVGDAKATLQELCALVPTRASTGAGRRRAADARERIRSGIASYELELGLLESIRAALPREAVTAWDMTILGYDASAYFAALEPRRFLYPLGSGTLGYAWPAAIGARVALPDTPVLAVAGDGGIQYGLAELAVARQYDVGAKLLVVDDGAYGVLKLYQEDSFQDTTAVDLRQPDFSQLVTAFGVPVRETSATALDDDLAWALGVPGPAVLVLRTRVGLVEPP